MRQLKELSIILAAGLLSVILFFISQGMVVAETDCDVDCLNEKMTALTRRVAALEKLIGVSGKTTVKAAKAKESFFQIGGGSATGSDWTRVTGSDFWFDQSLYGEVTEVTWQGWLDNGTGSVRLYDSTNGRAVDGSEVSVSAAGRASFYSSPLAIWRGQNQYHVQVKNANVQTVTVTTPRLRILGK